MLAASAAVATCEGDHVDFGHEVPAWLVGHDPGVKLSFAKETDCEDIAQENKGAVNVRAYSHTGSDTVFYHNVNSGADITADCDMNPLDVAEGHTKTR